MAAARARRGSAKRVKNFLCPYDNCFAQYAKLSLLQAHQNTHTNQKPFKCSELGCDKSYFRKDHLARHISSVHSESNNVRCEICSIIFKKESLETHIKRIHKSERHMCSHCGKRFLREQQLQIHEYNHTGIKPFVCYLEGCGKSFLLPSKLRAHEKVHDGYSCSVEDCNEIFDTWTKLIKHKQSAHKPTYQCKVCDKTFKAKARLKSHSATHEETRKCFHCSYEGCTRYYYYKTNLNMHVRRYHEEKKLICPIENCGQKFFNQRKLNHHLKVKACFKKAKKNIVQKPKRSLSAKLAGYIPSSEDSETSSNEQVKLNAKTFNDRQRRSITVRASYHISSNNDSETSSDEQVKESDKDKNNKDDNELDEVSSAECKQRSAA